MVLKAEEDIRKLAGRTRLQITGRMACNTGFPTAASWTGIRASCWSAFCKPRSAFSRASHNARPFLYQIAQW
jgi:hypothetical protein